MTATPSGLPSREQILSPENLWKELCFGVGSEPEIKNSGITEKQFISLLASNKKLQELFTKYQSAQSKLLDTAPEYAAKPVTLNQSQMDKLRQTGSTAINDMRTLIKSMITPIIRKKAPQPQTASKASGITQAAVASVRTSQPTAAANFTAKRPSPLTVPDSKPTEPMQIIPERWGTLVEELDGAKLEAKAPMIQFLDANEKAANALKNHYGVTKDAENNFWVYAVNDDNDIVIEEMLFDTRSGTFKLKDGNGAIREQSFSTLSEMVQAEFGLTEDQVKNNLLNKFKKIPS